MHHSCRSRTKTFRSGVPHSRRVATRDFSSGGRARCGGIECRLDDARTRELLAALNHHETALRVTAERAMNTRLEGGCQVPIGSYAELIDGEIWLRALVGAPDGSLIIRGERRGAPQDAEQMGISLAEELLNNGAREILAEVYNGDAPA